MSQRRSAAINTFLLNGLGTNRAVVAERLHRNCTGPNYWPDDRGAAGQDVSPGEAGVTMPCCLDTAAASHHGLAPEAAGDWKGKCRPLAESRGPGPGGVNIVAKLAFTS